MNRGDEPGAVGPDVIPLGDRAWLARFEDEDRAAAWAEAVRSRRWPGVVDVVAAYRTAAVYIDPERADPDEIEARLRSTAVPDGGASAGRLLRVPVLYDGADLTEVAGRLRMGVEEVIGLHAGGDYAVRAIGFLPGFPYLGELPDELAGLPRREPPRTRVPAGSVAIAGQQTCIYPGESPGGWHLLGRTPLVVADLAGDHFPMEAGDRVRFEPIDGERFEALRGHRLGPDAGEAENVGN